MAAEKLPFTRKLLRRVTQTKHFVAIIWQILLNSYFKVTTISCVRVESFYNIPTFSCRLVQTLSRPEFHLNLAIALVLRKPSAAGEAVGLLTIRYRNLGVRLLNARKCCETEYINPKDLA